jgi:hypothetical protein
MLASRAVAYINVDSGVSGPQLDLAATPSLATFAADILDEASQPRATSYP